MFVISWRCLHCSNADFHFTVCIFSQLITVCENSHVGLVPEMKLAVNLFWGQEELIILTLKVIGAIVNEEYMYDWVEQTAHVLLMQKMLAIELFQCCGVLIGFATYFPCAKI